MPEKLHIYISVIFVVSLILYSFFKWFLRGKIFHPGFIYSLINGLFLIVFALGPYDYLVKIPWSYFYVYALITTFFIVGLILGESYRIKKGVKDINLNNKNFWFLYFLILMPLAFRFATLGIQTNFSVDGAATNRLLEVSKASNAENSNLIKYTITSVLISFNQILPTVFLTYAFYKKKYIPIGIWLVLVLAVAILQNSRTVLIFSLFLMIIPLYTVRKTPYKGLHFARRLLFFIKNSLPKIVAAIAIFATLVVTITNARNEVRSATTVGAGNQTYQLVEQLYRAEKKQWFQSWLAEAPASSVDTIAELSLYAGGTVASGGVIARIATDTGLYTWGLRNFFVFHRVLSQLRLDGGLSDIARDNFLKVRESAFEEIPAVLSGWFGDPGNLILDFGYVGAPVASLITGWLVGWLYGSLCRSGVVINATATSVFAMAMLLTPSVNIFGLFLSNSINFFVLLLYLLIQKSALPKKIYAHTIIRIR